MSTAAHAGWSTANQAYLMTWVRALGEQLAAFRTEEERGQPDPDRLAAIRKQLGESAATMTAPPAIIHLADALGLSEFEQHLLVLCAGVELDAGVAAQVAGLQQDGAARMTFSLALAVLPEPHWSSLSPDSPLRHWRLIETDSRNPSPTRTAIHIDEHILHYLAGLSILHPRLEELARPLDTGVVLVPSQEQLADKMLGRCAPAAARGQWAMAILTGADRADKMAVAAAFGKTAGLRPYAISAAALPTDSGSIAEIARLWDRDAALNGRMLFLDGTGLDSTDKTRLQLVCSFLEQLNGPVLVHTEHWAPALQRASFIFEVEKPSGEEQLLLWKALIVRQGLEVADAAPHELVSRFNLGTGQILSTVQEVLSTEPSDVPLSARLSRACRLHSRPPAGGLVQPIRPVAVWDDLVLPAAPKNVLREMVAQLRHRHTVYNDWGFAAKDSRGLGLAALFAGESGTGKTMAAEVLANELQLDLYKVDLSKVVNKYIGETEKNLDKIFDAAENGGAILLFDEADALFGKRSEVKDSHDRYSNLEVSYLLQRMEAYRGLAILTTNMKAALDKAFLRRLRFIVQFPYPDAQMRAEIWRRVFPAKTPLAVLDIEQLAKLSVPGGNIRNIALNAAFIAADEGLPVQMSHISRAVRNEYSKIEKALGTAETAWL